MIKFFHIPFEIVYVQKKISKYLNENQKNKRIKKISLFVL